MMRTWRHFWRLSDLATVQFFPYFAVWAFCALSGIYVKWTVMSHSGFGCVGRALGRTRENPSDLTRATMFRPLERLSFFREDLLLGFCVLPLIGILLLYWLPKRWRMSVVIALAFSGIAFLLLQMRGFWVVGQFQSWQLWRDSIRWGIGHPEEAERYMGNGLPLKLCACFVALACMGIIFERFWDRIAASSRVVRVAALMCFASAIALPTVAWSCRLESTGFHRSALSLCVGAFLGADEVDLAKYNALSAVESMAQWRNLYRAPAPGIECRHFAAAKGYDLICFVWETAPTGCLDIAGNIDDLPSLKRLRQHAWIAPSHVTTYPYTMCAVSSILSSWYPAQMSLVARIGTQSVMPGFMQSLKQDGYMTAAYLPMVVNTDEDAIHRALGIERMFYAESATSPEADAARVIGWKEKITRDQRALDVMKREMSTLIRDHQRYAVLYLPQIGHAPWPDIVEDGEPRDTMARGRAILRLQDKWLGELISFLEQAGRLDRTIILVTGDHGLRTAAEDANFEGGAIGTTAYCVPCLLFAPGVLRETAVIPWVTSHIDLSPSLLHLFGIASGRELELGSPMWDERIRERVTFLWGSEFLGADGYHDRGHYYMWQRLSNMAYSSTRFEFRDAKPLQAGSAEGRLIVNQISDAIALQHHVLNLAIQQAEED